MKTKSSLLLKIGCLVIFTASACSILNFGTGMLTPTSRSMDDVKIDAFATITSQSLTEEFDTALPLPVFTVRSSGLSPYPKTPLGDLTREEPTITMTSTNRSSSSETGFLTTTPSIIATLTPILANGIPNWQDTFDTGKYWYLVNTSNTFFEMKNGKLQMHALSASEYEEWGIASIPPIKNFYLEVTFETGIKCDNRDRYGILFRSPVPNKGYVYGYSCDGEFRIYIWDGLNFISLQNWTFSESINAGAEQKNTLGVLAVDHNISLYGNGTLLSTLEDKTYEFGKLGLFIGADKNGPFEVDVEKVVYWLK